jgi:acyl-coenzyme A synthetase/AMP-(fatty) acid ligase
MYFRIEEEITMKDVHDFDILISSKKSVSIPCVCNIAEMIFKPLPHRDENSFVILSHDQEKYEEISLKKLRCVVSWLYQEFEEKKIKPGDTVLLTTLSVNNELYITLLFVALISYGARVLFPMFMESKVLDTWVKNTNCTTVIYPADEIQHMRGCPRQKEEIQQIQTVAQHNSLLTYDVSKDFHINTYLDAVVSDDFSSDNTLIQRCIQNTSYSTESVIFTTSGTSGKSKLVLYEQGAFLRNCQSWQESGMYQKDKLGGRSFIDILPHTISIRTLFNALWTGHPICIITTDWIKQKPQKILPFLMKMKPEVMTLGPSSFRLIVELIAIVPEVKELAFSELRTVVSTGAPYSKIITEEMKKQFNLYLYNAYGTTETQQVLTTVLCTDAELCDSDGSMGKPLHGVILGLKKYDGNLYRLFVKSPFGHKGIIGEKTSTAEEFFDTGDIVKVEKNNILRYMGREQKDFIKSGYGAKVPIIYLKEYYKELYEKADHIEYYAFETFNFSLGVAALIFITDDQLPTGRVTNKRAIKKYYNTLIKINAHLLRTLEPFEYEQRKIIRFLLINNHVFRTLKGTVSHSTFDEQFRDEIYDLLHSNNPKTGVKNLPYLRSVFLKFLIQYTPLKQYKLRKLLMKIVIKK